METFWGFVALCGAIILIAWGQGVMTELKRIRRELQKRNGNPPYISSSDEPETVQLLPGACASHVDELRYLVENRDVSEELLDHVDACENCRTALDRVMDAQRT